MRARLSYTIEFDCVLRLAPRSSFGEPELQSSNPFGDKIVNETAHCTRYPSHHVGGDGHDYERSHPKHV